MIGAVFSVIVVNVDESVHELFGGLCASVGLGAKNVESFAQVRGRWGASWVSDDFLKGSHAWGCWFGGKPLDFCPVQPNGEIRADGVFRDTCALLANGLGVVVLSAAFTYEEGASAFCV